MKQFGAFFFLTLAVMTQGIAQQNSSIDVALSSGYIIPSSPMTFANYWKMEYGGALSVGYPLSESVSLVGTGEYYRFSLNQTGISSGFDTKYLQDIWIFNSVSMKPSADPSSVISGSLNLRIIPSSITGILSPFLTAGAGVMRFTMSEINLPTTSAITINGSAISMTAKRRIIGGSETEAFVQFGLGFTFHAADQVNIFIEGRYAHGLSKGLGTSYIPLTAGIMYSL